MIHITRSLIPTALGGLLLCSCAAPSDTAGGPGAGAAGAGAPGAATPGTGASGTGADVGPERPRGRPIEPAAGRTLLEEAWHQRDEGLLVALDRTIEWLDASPPYARALRDGRTVTSFDVRDALADARDAFVLTRDAGAFAHSMLERFQLIRAIDFAAPGPDSVLLTAYFAPEYAARRDRAPGFDHPLHAIPPDLALDNPNRTTWHTRRTITEQDLLEGRAIAWLPDALSAYLVQVNGSARLDLGDGNFMHVGHVATNERAYTSLGRLLIDRGLAEDGTMSMATIRRLFEADPETVTALMLENDRYVFFEEVPASEWPRSSLGIALTPHGSIATDHAIYPPGVLVLVETELPNGDRYTRLMLNQDTGGAIRGPLRADLFFGVGNIAGDLAGHMKARGRMVVLVPR